MSITPRSTHRSTPARMLAAVALLVAAVVAAPSTGHAASGTTALSRILGPINGLTNVVALSSASTPTLALLSDGTVRAWGDNFYGELGDGTFDGSDTPVKVLGLHNVVAVGANVWQGLALTADGYVWSWGYNVNGELGLGYSSNDPQPTPERIPGLSNIVGIAVGRSHSLALTKDGHVYGWGHNYNGQAAPVESDYLINPIQVQGLSNIVAVAAGGDFNLALTRQGRVFQWGNMGVGNPLSAPTEVDGLAGIVAIAAGSTHSLALSREGIVYSWGTNDYGELGRPANTAGDPVPTVVPGLHNVEAIAAGSRTSVAVETNGTVWAWGDNTGNQLGAGALVDYQASPMRDSDPATLFPSAAGGSNNAQLHSLTLGHIAAPVSVALTPAGASGRGYKLLQRWASAYTQSNAATLITPTVADSAAAIDQWTAGQSPLAITDLPTTQAQDRAAQQRCAGSVTHLPLALYATALTYNLPGLHGALHLSGDLLARIYRGGVRYWNDVLIQRQNPGLVLPALPVRLVYRADPSGDTALLTRYLADARTQWATQVGVGGRVRWPHGQRARGSLGVVAQVLRTRGALGYVDYADALAQHLQTVVLRNGHAQSVAPSTAAMAAAATAAADSPIAQQNPVDVAAAGAYPLTGYVYADLCGKQSGASGQAVVDLLHYILSDGQKTLGTGYAALPPAIQAQAHASLNDISMTG